MKRTERAGASRSPRRTTRGGAAIALAALGATSIAALPPAPAAALSTQCWQVPGDVDGGGPDVVVGLPSFDLPGKPDAGAIVVYSNVARQGATEPKAPTARTLLTVDSLEGPDGLHSQAGGRFGASVTSLGDGGSLDDPDRCSDLLVGAPGQSVAGKRDAGQVYMLNGRAGGIRATRATFDEERLARTGGAQAGARFGETVAADGRTTIAIGVPGRDVAGATNAGRVDRLDDADLNGVWKATVVRQGQGGGGDAETGDRFGEALALMPSGLGAILVVGVPHEDVGRRADAGAVALLPPGGAMSMVSQRSAGAGGIAERGDRYGSSVDGYFTFTTRPVGVVAIGVPGEDVGRKADAGAVALASFDLPATGGVTGLRGRATVLTQDSSGVRGVTEAGDRYGSAVLTGEFGSDNGIRTIVASSPFEDVGRVTDAGTVTTTRTGEFGAPRPGSQPGVWGQDSPGTSGTAECGDRFGAGVSSVLLAVLESDVDTVWPVTMVTVPREDLRGRSDVGMAYLGYPPGRGSVPLVPPVLQAGAGRGMAPMRHS